MPLSSEYPSGQNIVDTGLKDLDSLNIQALTSMLKITGGSAAMPEVEASETRDLNADVLYSRKMRKEWLAKLHSKHEVQYNELLAELQKQTKV